MSNLAYKKQSVTELDYKLLLSYDLNYGFNILKNSVIEWQGISLEFSIIGSSHFVKINATEEDELIELIACIGVNDITAENIIKQKKLVDNHQYKYSKKITPAYMYRFYSEAIEDYLVDHQEFKDKYMDTGCDRYLEYVFPSPGGLAITSIEIYQKIDKLIWVTYHSYPDEKKIIKTRSVIEVRSG